MDLTAAQEFIYALTGNPHTQIAFQVFDDTQDKDHSKARQYTGDIAELESKLEKHNQDRCGVFVFVNPVAGGFSAEHVTELRAAFVDKDDGPLGSLAVRPSFVVRTSAGEHAYWLLKPDEKVEDFKPFHEKLITKLGTDKQVKNPNRVMRLPGTMHHKGEPTETRLKVNDTQTKYTLKELSRAFGLDERRKPKPESRSVDKATAIERCAAYMDKVPPAVEGDGGDQATYRAACVGADFGLTDAEFWPILCRWNRTCEPPWDEEDLTRKLRNAARYRNHPIGEKAPPEHAPPPEWDDEEPPLPDEQPDTEEEGFHGAPDDTPDDTPDDEKQERDPRLHLLTPGEALDIWQDRADDTSIPSPIDALNRAIGGGFPVGAVTTVSAYTGCYKSEFVRQMIKHAASQGFGAVHVDIELGEAEIISRYLSEESGVPHSIVRNRKRRSVFQLDAIMKAREVIRGQRWLINCPGSGMPIETIEQTMIAELPDTGATPTLVVFDSLQRLSAGMPAENVRMRVEGFCRWLEGFAKQHRVAVLAVSEQSRAQGGGKPGAKSALTSGAESRSIEYVSSVLIALDGGDDDPDDEPEDLSDSDKEGESIVGIRISKNRYGWEGLLKDSMVFCRPCWQMRIEKNGLRPMTIKVRDALEAARGQTIRDLIREIGSSNHKVVKSHLKTLEKLGTAVEVDRKWYLNDAVRGA